MQILKRVLQGLAVVIVLLLVIGLLLPKAYLVERSITIRTDVDKVHAQVGDLRSWPAWTPWLEADPTIRTTLGAKTGGVGAHQSWTGESGSGELTFTLCDAERGVGYEMAFIEGETRTPSTGGLYYRELPEGTEVTWRMEGEMEMPFVGGWFALLFDGMVGPMFEDGLAKLKAVCEEG